MKKVLINYKLRDCHEAMRILPHVSINVNIGPNPSNGNPEQIGNTDK